MKYFISILYVVTFISCQPKNSSETTESNIQKSDLSKIKWLEGHWAGIYQGGPFYETYRMLSDSNFQIKTYAHVGTDTAKVEYDSIYWKDGSYFMGPGPKYKVVSLTDTEIKMIPLQSASNEVLFRFANDSTWTAILSGQKDTIIYRMQMVSSMDSLLSSIK